MPTSFNPRTAKLFRVTHLMRTETVERWNSFSKTRKDLLGIFDIIAYGGNYSRIIGIQACERGDRGRRLGKMLLSPELTPWLLSGGQAMICAWSKKQTFGRGKLLTWQPHLTLFDLDKLADSALSTLADELITLPGLVNTTETPANA